MRLRCAFLGVVYGMRLGVGWGVVVRQYVRGAIEVLCVGADRGDGDVNGAILHILHWRSFLAAAAHRHCRPPFPAGVTKARSFALQQVAVSPSRCWCQLSPTQPIKCKKPDSIVAIEIEGL